jgi:hypothetical protein
LPFHLFKDIPTELHKCLARKNWWFSWFINKIFISFIINELFILIITSLR